ncbi:MAG: universal stress protein [Myxococcota bacterium]
MRTILVPTRFDPTSRRAVRSAARLQRDHDHRVVLLHAVKPPAREALSLSSEPTEALERRCHRREEKLEARAEAVFHDTDDVRTHVTVGAPAQVISRFAAEKKPALVVMGSDEGPPSSRLLYGSVTLDVIHKVDQDVLIVPESASPAQLPPRRVLIATALEGEASTLIDHAARWVESDAEIELFHVVSRPLLGSADRSLWMRATEQLAKLAARRTRPDVRIRSHLVQANDVAPAIISRGHDIEADMLVVGQRDRGLLRSLVTQDLLAELHHRIARPTLFIPLPPTPSEPAFAKVSLSPAPDEDKAMRSPLAVPLPGRPVQPPMRPLAVAHARRLSKLPI